MPCSTPHPCLGPDKGVCLPLLELYGLALKWNLLSSNCITQIGLIKAVPIRAPVIGLYRFTLQGQAYRTLGCAIQGISIRETICVIHWINIYAVDSVIPHMNN